MIFITADLHLNDNPRDEYRFRFLRRLPAILKREGAEHLLILGDLTDEKDRHGAWLVNAITDHLVRITKYCPVTVLRGNHDYSSVDDPFFAFLDKMPGIEYISTPTLRLMPIGRALFLPHTTDYKNDWSAINHDVDWIFAHQTFTGAEGSMGVVLSGIPLDALPPVNVISGDVHVPQTMQNLTYVGAPYTINFGDDFAPRALLISAREIKSIPLGGPQKLLIEVQSLKELEEYRDYVQEGDIIKVRVNLKPDQYQDWPKIQAAVREWGAEVGTQIYIVQPEVAPSAVNQRRRDSERLSDEDLLIEYAKHRGIDPRTLKTGQSLL